MEGPSGGATGAPLLQLPSRSQVGLICKQMGSTGFLAAPDWGQEPAVGPVELGPGCDEGSSSLCSVRALPSVA